MDLYGSHSITPSETTTKTSVSTNHLNSYISYNKPYFPKIKDWIYNNPSSDPLYTGSPIFIHEEKRKIGNGNFGQVYETDDKYAFKSLALKCVSDNDAWDKFLKEYNLWLYITKKNTDSKNRHISKHIAMVKELRDFIIPDYPFKLVGITMKLYKDDLDGHVKKLKERDEYNRDKVLSIMQHIIKGVSALHTFNIIHGDVAKRNFLVDKKDRVVITDFGLSHKYKSKSNDTRMTDENSSTIDSNLEKETDQTSSTNTMPSTYAYYEDEDPQAQPFWWCAPEVVEDMLKHRPLKYSTKTDCYMVGCTFSELIVDENSLETGRSYIPFSHDGKKGRDLTNFNATKKMEECLALKKRGPLDLKGEFFLELFLNFLAETKIKNPRKTML